MAAELSPNRLPRFLAFKDSVRSSDGSEANSSVVNGAMLLVADELLNLPVMTPEESRKRMSELLSRRDEQLASVRGRIGEFIVSGRRKGIGRLKKLREDLLDSTARIHEEYYLEGMVQQEVGVFERGVSFYEKAVRAIENSKGLMVGRKKRRYEQFLQKLAKLRLLQTIFGPNSEDDRK